MWNKSFDFQALSCTYISIWCSRATLIVPMLQVQVLFLFPPPIIEVSMIRVSIILFRLVHANNNSNKKCACLIACFLPNYTCNFSAVLLSKCVHTRMIGIGALELFSPLNCKLGGVNRNTPFTLSTHTYYVIIRELSSDPLSVQVVRTGGSSRWCSCH